MTIKEIIDLTEKSTRIYYEAKRSLSSCNFYDMVHKDWEHGSIYNLTIDRKLDDHGQIYYEYRITAFDRDAHVIARRITKGKHLSPYNIYKLLMVNIGIPV